MKKKKEDSWFYTNITANPKVQSAAVVLVAIGWTVVIILMILLLIKKLSQG